MHLNIGRVATLVCCIPVLACNRSTTGTVDGGVDATSMGDAHIDATSMPDVGVDMPSPDVGIDMPSIDARMDMLPTDTGIDMPSVDARVDMPPTDTGVDMPSTDTGVDMPPVDLGGDSGSACPGAIAIDCASGTVASTTALSAIATWGDCTSGTGYDRDEAIFTFTTGMPGRYDVTLSTTEPAGTDYDLFAVYSSACDGTGTCAGGSRGGTGDESVEFAATDTDAILVGYDRYATGMGPTSFSLTVGCVPVICGDGAIGLGETCDDGNAYDGDGCSSTCATEPGWLCVGAPSACHLVVCGDGVVETTEPCDDGNTTSGDGCSSTCTVERLYTCTGAPSVCTTTCGDGTRNAGEECDDGNLASGDGCSGCVIESGWGCTGAPSACAMFTCGNLVLDLGETCDDGNTTSGDGCDATCRSETFTAVPLGVTTVTGAIDATTPTFARPNVNFSTGACTTATTSAYHYEAFVLENTSTSVETLTINAAWGGDGYLVVYTPPFAPAMPLAECMVGNDDFMGVGRSQVTGVAIPPGGQIIVVTTTYGAGATTGAFTLTITAT